MWQRQSNHNSNNHRQIQSVQLANFRVQTANAFRSHNFVITTTIVEIIAMSRDSVPVSRLNDIKDYELFYFLLLIAVWAVGVKFKRKIIFSDYELTLLSGKIF